eukprot:TRINITY_DN4811_c0_g1_i1.p1 TRINITY_DN4811_c0_g1~~TRINITY_DN4811_c0_g1_i1.p1  ORF type:complete len:235 (-),score=75.78 TRINITY_DN4811_c0_g1_i1:124-828(-)
MSNFDADFGEHVTAKGIKQLRNSKVKGVRVSERDSELHKLDHEEVAQVGKNALDELRVTVGTPSPTKRARYNDDDSCADSEVCSDGKLDLVFNAISKTNKLLGIVIDSADEINIAVSKTAEPIAGQTAALNLFLKANSSNKAVVTPGTVSVENDMDLDNVGDESSSDEDSSNGLSDIEAEENVTPINPIKPELLRESKSGLALHKLNAVKKGIAQKKKVAAKKAAKEAAAEDES